MEALVASEEKRRQATLDLLEACGTLEELKRWHKEYKKSWADLNM